MAKVELSCTSPTRRSSRRRGSPASSAGSRLSRRTRRRWPCGLTMAASGRRKHQGVRNRKSPMPELFASCRLCFTPLSLPVAARQGDHPCTTAPPRGTGPPAILEVHEGGLARRSAAGPTLQISQTQHRDGPGPADDLACETTAARQHCRPFGECGPERSRCGGCRCLGTGAQ